MQKEMKTIQNQTRERLAPILSPEQLAQYDELQEQWRLERQQAMGERPPR
jgi:hypothetical protein